MGEADINMDMVMPLSNTPSKPTTQQQLQFVPFTPENPSRPFPEQGSRSRTRDNSCFKCGKEGHWYRQCPQAQKNPNNSPPPNTKNIYCRCGHGFCSVKTSKTTKNFGRTFFVCPIKEGKQCRGFIGFCDEKLTDDRYDYPPQYKYPVCECGAGVCAKERDPNADRKFRFVCPVQPGHGHCGFIVTEDELRSKQQIVGLNGTTGELCVAYPESMTTMENPEAPSLTAISEVPLGDDASPKATPPREVDLYGFDVIDADFAAEDVNWDDVDKEAESFQLRFATMTGPTCRQNLFGNNSFNDAIDDNAPAGIFPSDDEITVSEQPTTGGGDSPAFHQVAVTSLSEDSSHSSRLGIIVGDTVSRDDVSAVTKDDVSVLTMAHSHSKDSNNVVADTVPGGNDIAPTMTQGTKRKLMSGAERKQKMVSYMLGGLLTDLKDLDICDPDSVRAAVEAVDGCLPILQEHDLSDAYKLFCDHVGDYINNVSAIAEIGKSMENHLTQEESNRIIEEETTKRAKILEQTVKTEAMYKACMDKRLRLHEEILRMEAEILVKRNQLKSYESETMAMESCLGDLKRRKVEADTILKGKAEEAELARRLSEERKRKQMVAEAALKKAKHELEK
ncbi:hypothetical protein PIB30_000013 [Stylosanthes scabra]|uniref:CCHC-type domain-containing protein n=1 Tax=Stylosanthes scabra TaxID=79078 RepID=A0ABU6Q1V2_9FABA|nr:hypothetical protein [Stylosanthes scabra]